MITQEYRFASVTSDLGLDVLLFNGMSGHEEMGRLYEYQLDLLVTEENLAQIDSKKILGHALCVTLQNITDERRYFHGFVTEFMHQGEQENFYQFRATIQPWLWFLTRGQNCRVFQKLTVPDIIEKIIKLNGFSDFDCQYSDNYPIRDYCVQYRESDFDFVSRLMEQEGIYYYFKHDNARHCLVLADSTSAYQAKPEAKAISYFSASNTQNRSKEYIYAWQNTQTIQAKTFILKDFNFEEPKADLLAITEMHSDVEFYDYPGNYTELDAGKNYAAIRLEELACASEVIQGKAVAMSLATGNIFTLTGHYLGSENCENIVIATDFVIESNHYRSTNNDELSFTCQFTALRATQTFRSRRLTPIPLIQGPQTALVVGKSGEDFWTDKYGRIKVQFHWDRTEEKNENSSCWIRVAQPVAGKKWGWVSIPRIGQEVLVSFVDGNPDRPLVTGSMYNADYMPPYDLPSKQTQSGIKTHSSKHGSDDNYNELRFDDELGDEEVYVHAEKDFNCVIENNETRKIGLDKKSPGNQTIEIQNNRKATLNQGNDELEVKQGNHSIKVVAGKSTIEAMTSIELKVGTNSIKIEQSGITINGMMVSVEGKTKLAIKSPFTTLNADALLKLDGAITMIN